MEKLRIWQIKDAEIREVETKPMREEQHSEEHLEDWIMKAPGLVMEGFRPFGRQVGFEGVGTVDVFGVLEDGTLVIVELKKDRGPRQSITQLLDYASWLDELEDVAGLISDIKEKSQEKVEELLEEMGLGVEALDPSKHMLVLVDTEIDPVKERMVRYLAERGMDINFVVIQYFKSADGEEFLARSSHIDKEVLERVRNRETERPSTLELRARFEDFLTKNGYYGYFNYMKDFGTFSTQRGGFIFLIGRGRGRERRYSQIGRLNINLSNKRVGLCLYIQRLAKAFGKDADEAINKLREHFAKIKPRGAYKDGPLAVDLEISSGKHDEILAHLNEFKSWLLSQPETQERV